MNAISYQRGPTIINTYKGWKLDEAIKRNTTLHAIEMQISRGAIKTPKLLKKNKRVFYVIA